MKAGHKMFSTDSNAQCVTDGEAYIAVTNKYAVHNVMLMCKQELNDQGLEMHKPPSNENWRFGCYKAKDSLITKTSCWSCGAKLKTECRGIFCGTDTSVELTCLWN